MDREKFKNILKNIDQYHLDESLLNASSFNEIYDLTEDFYQNNNDGNSDKQTYEKIFQIYDQLIPIYNCSIKRFKKFNR